MTGASKALGIAALLCISLQAQAAGFGWYYDSFSWPAIQAYFGGAAPTKQLRYHEHLEALIKREQNNPYYNIMLGPQQKELWRSFIRDGLRYEQLSHSETRFADSVISIVMSHEAGLDEVDVRSHTAPDYVHPEAFRHLSTYADPKAQVFLELFRFGRSYGRPDGRSECGDDSEAWYCLEAYIVLSPDECSSFGKQLLKILKSPVFQDSEFEERKIVTPLAMALVKAGGRKRGMYLRATD